MTDLGQSIETVKSYILNFLMSHSLSKQVTFIRNINSVANLNTEALVNLSTIVKDNVVKAHGKFQETS